MSEIISNGGLLVDPNSETASINGQDLGITYPEYKILLALNSQIGETITLAELTRLIYNGASHSKSTIVWNYIANLRKILPPHYIFSYLTRNAGYRASHPIERRTVEEDKIPNFRWEGEYEIGDLYIRLKSPAVRVKSRYLDLKTSQLLILGTLARTSPYVVPTSILREMPFEDKPITEQELRWKIGHLNRVIGKSAQIRKIVDVGYELRAA